MLGVSLCDRIKNEMIRRGTKVTDIARRIGCKVLEWRLCTERGSVVRHPTRWSDEITGMDARSTGPHSSPKRPVLREVQMVIWGRPNMSCRRSLPAYMMIKSFLNSFIRSDYSYIIVIFTKKTIPRSYTL